MQLKRAFVEKPDAKKRVCFKNSVTGAKAAFFVT